MALKLPDSRKLSSIKWFAVWDIRNQVSLPFIVYGVIIERYVWSNRECDNIVN